MDLFNLTCGDCAHYQGERGKGRGVCFRYPPTPVPVQQPASVVQASPGTATANFGVMGIRVPITADTPACGECAIPEGEETAPNGDPE